MFFADLHPVECFSIFEITFAAHGVRGPSGGEKIALVAGIDEHTGFDHASTFQPNAGQASPGNKYAGKIFAVKNGNLSFGEPLLEYILGDMRLEIPGFGCAVVASDLLI
jgi:hypothetical protein